jgi:hypothetical protein
LFGMGLAIEDASGHARETNTLFTQSRHSEPDARAMHG